MKESNHELECRIEMKNLLIFFFISLLLSNGDHLIAANDTIFYTTNNDAIIKPCNTEAFDANIISNSYADSCGYIVFDGCVRRIGKEAFCNNWRLTSITLPDSIDYIGESAFQNCTRLAEIIFPDSINMIDSYAFLNCKKLNFDISSIQKTNIIGQYAFAGCTKLTGRISQLQNLIEAGDYAFADCPETVIDTLLWAKADTTNTIFRFLTWNIEGLAWGTNHLPAEEDSIVESKGIKQLIAKYDPRIYTLNEVPSYLSRGQSPAGSGVKLVCGDSENQVHSVACVSHLKNAIVTKDIIIDREDHSHSFIYKNHRRNFGITTQYIDGKIVAIAVIHFEPTPKNSPEDIQKQINDIRVSSAQDVFDAIKDYEYAIVAGDFNCNYPIYGEDLGGVATPFVEGGFTEVKYKRRWYVDHIFIKGFEALDRDMDNLDLKLSDHPLLWVDLKIN